MDFSLSPLGKSTRTLPWKNRCFSLAFMTLVISTPAASYAETNVQHEIHALRTELANLYQKIAKLEKSQISSPEQIGAPHLTHQIPVVSQQTHDDEDSLFHSDESTDYESASESRDDHSTKVLSIDGLIAGFPMMPVPPGWTRGSMPASAIPETNRPMVTPMAAAGVHHAKLLLQNKQMLHARNILAELVRNNISPEYPFALYWLGILDLHENRLDSALDLFFKTYEYSKIKTDPESQKLCVAALLRITQVYLRKNNASDAKKFFLLCQKQAKPMYPVLPRHILAGIKKMRAQIKQLRPSQTITEGNETQSEQRQSLQEKTIEETEKSEPIRVPAPSKSAEPAPAPSKSAESAPSLVDKSFVEQQKPEITQKVIEISDAEEDASY